MFTKGERFGRWVVMGTKRMNGRNLVIVRCSCGFTAARTKRNLRRGRTRGCRSCASVDHATHGMSASRTYAVWIDMRTRCLNPKSTYYKNYGGRGISIAPRWSTFEGFFNDMGEAPDGMTLDRIDNDSNYTPDNCRWATHTQQANNRRSSRHLICRGRTQTMAEWSRDPICSVTPQTIWKRLDAGWDIEKAITTPSRLSKVAI